MNIYNFLGKITTHTKSIFQALPNARQSSVFFDAEPTDFDYLRSDNWGGEGEKKVSQKTLDNLYTLIDYIPDFKGICPGCKGTIGIVYTDSKSYMYIEIKENKSSIYLEEGGVETCEEDLNYKDMLIKARSFWKRNISCFSSEIHIDNKFTLYQECTC